MARHVYGFDRAGIFDGEKEHNSMGYFFPHSSPGHRLQNQK